VRRRRRLSALVVDNVGYYFGRLVSSLVTFVAKIVCFDDARQVTGQSFSLSLLSMADPSLGDTASTLHTMMTVATSGSALTLGPANNFLSRTEASAMAQFTMELREL